MRVNFLFSIRLGRIILISLFIFPLSVAAQTADDAVGTWLSENGTHLKVYKCNANLCIKIAMAINTKTKQPAPDLKDSKNKDISLRDRLLQGTDIMTGATKKSATSWEGTIYNPSDGGTYSGTLSVQNKDKISLKGCWVWPICSTETWTRVQE